ncbi:MAG: glycosyltransferase family 39 protein [Anaerolineales bacterium]
MTSLIGALAMSVMGESFQTAQVPFLVLTALLPLFTAYYSYSIHHDRRAAFLAGLLASVPGFFLPYFMTTDMFILYAWIGTIYFWSMHRAQRQRSRVMWLITGLSVGVAHLSRADGLLFMIPLIYYLSMDKNRFFSRASLVIAGYLLVMGPWFYRNWTIYGSVMPPGTQSALWLRSYEDLFRYPASDLSRQYLFKAGWNELIVTRLSALWINLQRIIGENGLIFLLPFMLAGFIDQWKLRIVRSAALYWIVLIFVMSFIFPFAGAQGGTFHSSAALMPTLWMLVPFGLRRIISWVGARRGWNIPQATINFSWIFVFLAGLFTAGVYIKRVYGFGLPQKAWGSDFRTYKMVGEELDSIEPDVEIVMVNNPPGFFGATGIRAIVVPSGGLNSLRQAIEDYSVDYLLLDRNYPNGLADIYTLDQVPDWLLFRTEMIAGNSGPIRIFQTHVDQGG